MATYSTLAQAEQMYGAKQIAVAFDFDDDGAVDSSRFELHQQIAFGEINACLLGHHALPLTYIPPLLTKIEVDIALYNACIIASKRTEEMRLRYEDAMKKLKMLAKNEMKLETSEGGTSLNESKATTMSQARSITFETGARQFTSKTMKGVV